MKAFNSLSTLVVNPIAFAICASGVAFAAGTASKHDGSNHRAPAQANVVFHDAKVRLAEGPLEVHELDAIVTEGEISIEPDEAETRLAARFMEAMRSGALRPVRTPQLRPQRAETATKAKTWTCGQWEDLWQGRGQGRTCDWK